MRTKSQSQQFISFFNHDNIDTVHCVHRSNIENDFYHHDHRLLPIHRYLLRVVSFTDLRIDVVGWRDIYRHQVLPNPEDIGPLKALIAYDALVHPDHPLRKDGINGIELFIGGCTTGVPLASRLLTLLFFW